MRTIHHFGIPTKTPQKGEFFVDGLKVWLTDIDASPNKIEFLRFEPETWMPKLLQEVAHIAYVVDNMEEELKGAKVIVEPMIGDDKDIAFIEEEGIPIELMWYK